MKLTKKKDATPKAEGKKEKRRKRRSEGSGMDGVKLWFANNGEKLALGVVTLLALWIVFSGFRKKGLEETQKPEYLDSQIKNAESAVKNTAWEDIQPTRYPEVDRFDERATLDTEMVLLDQYVMTKPLHRTLEKQQKLRVVPQILAATELEVRAGYGPLALKNPQRSDAENPYENSEINTRSIPRNLAKRFSESASNALIKPVYFVSVLGLVPIREQLHIYNEAFIDAAEFKADRDFPKYVAVLLRRREVTANGNSDWVDIDTISLTQKYMAEWQVNREGLVDNRYKHEDSSFILMDLPMIIGKDLSRYAVHSKTKTKDQVEEEERLTNDEERGRDFNDQESNYFTERKSRKETLDSTLSTAEQQFELLKSDVLLFRFFDIEVEPGKVYQYQAQLLLADPNDPKDQNRPSEIALDVSVIEQRHANRSKPSHKQHVLESDWSEVSSSVAVPIGGNVLASQAAHTRRKLNVILSHAEPKAQVLAVAWDDSTSMEIPVELEVHRGSFLNKQLDKAEAVDPQQQVVVELKNFQFATNMLIVDIAGGDPLTRNAARDMAFSPSRILVMSPNGHMQFHQEIEDFDEYQSNVIPPDPRLLEELENKKNMKSEEELREEDGPGRKKSRRRGNNRRDRDREE